MTNEELEAKVNLLEKEIAANTRLWVKMVVMLEKNLARLKNPVIRINK